MKDILNFIQNHSALTLAFIVVLVLLMIIEFMRFKNKINQLSPAQVTQLINHQDAVIIDIRKPEEFSQGHIVDAVSLPAADLTSTSKKLEKFKSRPIVIVCATGTEAGTAATELAKQGFTIFVLNGGMRAWRNADMPIVKG